MELNGSVTATDVDGDLRHYQHPWRTSSCASVTRNGKRAMSGLSPESRTPDLAFEEIPKSSSNTSRLDRLLEGWRAGGRSTGGGCQLCWCWLVSEFRIPS